MKNMKKLTAFIAAITIMLSSCAQSKENVKISIQTSLGTIEAELFTGQAPETVKNFLGYADSEFYNGTIFHRVIRGFMIQGGGHTSDMKQKPTKAPIKNEAKNGLKNLKGTLAMARTQDINSATSQFFINTADNSFLDHGTRDYGYCVFGKVTSGMNVVEAIETVRTGQNDIPLEKVEIISIKRIK